eukprot:CAMPEP_0117082806 /NCGR_PEP_ID=MMETSP0472-20121206/58317_1 /TAXON_ID=693140 ORGANISM="Tiarina fusus, Strain LIS" /NCGR_SAMPLE_ID=MMETSP0472 /ASSEMBLY_ACC=CAM_ASM_000603 /LENGTH=979 /DNA_ID=CAMNT_0004811205 /DNA_START=157 /DNA_END=3096 /DNA_ORIENTATION=+
MKIQKNHRTVPLLVALAAALAAAHTVDAKEQDNHHNKLRHVVDTSSREITNNNENNDENHRKLQFPDLGIDLGNLDLGDLGNFDWSQIDFENFDWSNIDLSTFNWGDLFGSDGGNLDLDNICPIIEGLIGIGQEFGIAGGCGCDGDFTNGLSVSCAFEDECVEPWVCGSIGLNVTLGEAAGSIAADVCVDLVGPIPEICYGYNLNEADSTITQTCTASYDGNQCVCEISDSCLKIDCGLYLPGAVMDTCQVVDQLATEADAANLVPRFQVFDPDFLISEIDIDWSTLDWANLDWENFDLESFWNNFDLDAFNSTSWSDIFGFDFDTASICPALEQLAGLGEAFGIAGGCTCEGTLMSGLEIDCSFENQCAENLPDCATVGFNVSLGETPGAFSTDVCVDLGTYPEICYKYDYITSADGAEITQSCEATYDNNECICEIDSENYCMLIDCGQFLPGAVMDTCQPLLAMTSSSGGAATTTVTQTLQAENAVAFIPRFQVFEPDFQFDFGQDFDFTNLDWANLDLANFDLEGLFNQTDFATTEWGEIFGAINFETAAFCPLLEQFAGLGQDFGIVGGCTCEGSLNEGLGINCNFEDQCAPAADDGIAACGSIDFGMSLGQTPGTYSTNICVELSDGVYPEVCYTYDLMTAADGSTIAQSCTATYDDNMCGCEIDENSCMLIDCGNYLPGAVMDTCQYLGADATLQFGADAANFLPRFQVLDPNFEVNFEEVDWMSIDWTNLDWQNFDVDSLWNHSDWANTEWSDIFSADVDADSICPLLEHFAGVGAEFGIDGGCACSGDSVGGLGLDCSFQDVCVDGEETLCGSTTLGFDFDGLGAIVGEACVDFSGDEHPITCFKYSVPLADEMTAPTCEATYGGDGCDCAIDENFCVSIDCSDYNGNAVTSTCSQVLTSWNTAADATVLVPRFSLAADDGETSNGGTPPGNDGLQGGDTDALNNGSSASLARKSLVLAMVCIGSIALLL